MIAPIGSREIARDRLSVYGVYRASELILEQLHVSPGSRASEKDLSISLPGFYRDHMGFALKLLQYEQLIERVGVWEIPALTTAGQDLLEQRAAGRRRTRTRADEACSAGSVEQLAQILDPPPEGFPREAAPPSPAPPPKLGARAEDEPICTLDEAQRQHIERALERSGGRLYGAGGAAELLGLKPSTLQSKIVRLKVARTPGRSRPKRTATPAAPAAEVSP